MIFPSLQAMIKRGSLNVPVIGVSKSGRDVGQFKACAIESPKTRRTRVGGI
jgi:glucose-6-phosphate 1-dehydrogenase